MALPGSAAGIGVLVTPSTDAAHNVQLWRKTTDAGSTYVQLTELKGSAIVGGYRYFDPLPASTRTYTYRARNVEAGKENGTWWPTVSARPEIP